MRVTGSDEPSCCVHAPQVVAFVPLDSRASSRMTARGALSRQKERGHRAVRIKEGGNPGERRTILLCTCPTGGCLCSSGFPSKLENDGAGRPKPPEGTGTPRRQNQRRRESRVAGYAAP